MTRATTQPEGTTVRPVVADACALELAECAPAVSLVTLRSGCAVPKQRIRTLSKTSAVVVFGPQEESGWRGEALAAGALSCFSDATPLEDRACLLAAAVRYHESRRETAALRQHCERICFDLVRSFGSAMERLATARECSARLERCLRDTQSRILRALL